MKTKQKEIRELANKLEEPRAIRLLAEWLAIDHNETRLQFEKYMESAQELYEYITLIIGYNVAVEPLVRKNHEKQTGNPSKGACAKG